MPYFSQAALADMRAKLDWTRARQRELTGEFVERQWTTDTGKEHAEHGAARRLAILTVCIERVFELIPPEADAVPARDTRMQATVFIQSFVLNAFGFFDNLAHILVAERDIRGANGRPLDKRLIGLRSTNNVVRSSLSREAQAQLIAYDNWFGHLTTFRDHLAHRIPLYVIPFIIVPDEAEQYQQLSADLMAAIRNGDLDRAHDIKARRRLLEHYRPWMAHSVHDPNPPVVFHPQMLADFATVERIASLILEELDRIPG